MDTRISRFAPPWRRKGLCFVAAAFVALSIAMSAVTGVGARTADGPLEPSLPTYEDVVCPAALIAFKYHVDWILEYVEDHPDFDPNDPELAYHRDQMWGAWYTSEVVCGVDVGGNGELGP